MDGSPLTKEIYTYSRRMIIIYQNYVLKGLSNRYYSPYSDSGVGGYIE